MDRGGVGLGVVLCLFFINGHCPRESTRQSSKSQLRHLSIDSWESISEFARGLFLI